MKANIAVKANVWCVSDQNETGSPPYFLQSVIPGDLAVELLGSKDLRITQKHLTQAQHIEFEQSKFFQKYGQEGLAFDP